MNTLIDSWKKQFRYYKLLAEKSIDQLDSNQLNIKLDNGSLSINEIRKHIAGNMISRFTDFQTSDGEKSWRNREGEFVYEKGDAIQENWDLAWGILFSELEKLKIEDLESIVYIRNEGHTIIEALQRQLAHYCSHIGQIIFIAKHLKGNNWQSLSIAPGKTAEFNSIKFSKPKGKRHFTEE